MQRSIIVVVVVIVIFIIDRYMANILILVSESNSRPTSSPTTALTSVFRGAEQWGSYFYDKRWMEWITTCLSRKN